MTIGTRLDDLPIAIFATREEAVELSKLCEHEDCVFHRTALEQTDRDYAEPVCVAISEFRDGLMVSHDVVRIFEDEDDANKGEDGEQWKGVSS